MTNDKTSRIFSNYLAAGCVGLGFIYIFAITFLPISDSSQRLADMILGMVLSAVFGQILSYYFGSSNSSKNKDKIIEELNKENP